MLPTLAKDDVKLVSFNDTITQFDHQSKNNVNILEANSRPKKINVRMSFSNTSEITEVHMNGWTDLHTYTKLCGNKALS